MTDYSDLKEKAFVPRAGIEMMIETIQTWMSVNGQLRDREGLKTTPDTAIITIPCNFWPNHQMFQNWIDALTTILSLLEERDRLRAALKQIVLDVEAGDDQSSYIIAKSALKGEG